MRSGDWSSDVCSSDLTGQPLPLISKGGTSTLVSCVYIGMILSVSRYTILLAEQKRKEQELQEEQESLNNNIFNEEMPEDSKDLGIPSISVPLTTESKAVNQL